MTQDTPFPAQRTSLREAVANELLAHGSFSSTGHGGENALVAADAVIAIIAQVEQKPDPNLVREVAVLLARHDYRFGLGGNHESEYAFATSYKFEKRAAEIVAFIKGDRCTCGGDPDQPADHHDISCPLAVSSAQEKTP